MAVETLARALAMLFRLRPSRPAPASRPVAPTKAEPTEVSVMLPSGEVSVQLKRNPRARRYTLRLRTATRDVVLTMPARGSLKEAVAFAHRQAEWIEARLARLSPAIAFVPGALVPIRGIPHRIVHEPDMRGTVWTGRGDEPLLHVAGETAHVARRVTDFLKREAKRDLVEASQRHARRLGVTISRVTLRDTKSRWGSCSTNGSLSYSWRLIFAPAFVLDYLAAHEVAHRREMNHGQGFWDTVDRLFPDRHAAEAWLKKNGPELHRYGAGTQ
jgi:predicted metal-dependent hydrolase